MNPARQSRFITDRPALVGEAVVAGLLVGALAVDVVSATFAVPPDDTLSVYAVAVLGPVLAVTVVLTTGVAGIRSWRADRSLVLRAGSVIRGLETLFALGVLGVTATIAWLRLEHGPGGGAVLIVLFAAGALLSLLLAVTVVGHAALAVYGTRP